MDNLEEIKQQLKDISDSIQSHRNEWKSTVQNALMQQQKFMKKRWIIIAFLFIILMLIFYSPYLTNPLFTPRQPEPEMDYVLMFMGPSDDTQKFDGRYEIDEECLNSMISSIPAETKDDPNTNKAMSDLLRRQYSNVSLNTGVFRCGKDLIQEFRMRGVVDEAGEYVGGALWHEDIDDPGDASVVNVKMKSENGKLYFFYAPLGTPFDKPIVFKKIND